MAEDFPTFPASAVAELVYVSPKGREPAGEKIIDFKDGDADSRRARLAKLKAVVERFEDEQQPYLLVLPMWKTRYGSYDHLARVKEWAVGGTDEAEPVE